MKQLIAACLSCLLPLAGGAGILSAAPASEQPVRFGFTVSIVRNANENDFRSAMRAYARLIADSSNIKAAPDQAIFHSPAEVLAALSAGEVDLVGGSSAELLDLPETLLEPPFIASVFGGTVGAEYVLLVRADSGWQTLAELAGRRIALLDSGYGALIKPWLEYLLHSEKLPESSVFFHDIRLVTKPSLGALPVYFRQMDACIITAAGFATLTELNPQLTRQMHAIALSPRLVPIVTIFRRGMDPGLRQAIRRTIGNVGNTTTGRQLLTLFQCDSLRFLDEAELLPTRQLLSGRPLPPGAMNRLVPSPTSAP